MSETYYNAIETLSRRRAEVSAEIVKQNEVVLELNRAIKILQGTVPYEPVCSICNGTGCSTCCPSPSDIVLCRQCQAPSTKVAIFQADGLCSDCSPLVAQLPELKRCSQCGEHAGFLYAGLCLSCKGTK